MRRVRPRGPSLLRPSRTTRLAPVWRPEAALRWPTHQAAPCSRRRLWSGFGLRLASLEQHQHPIQLCHRLLKLADRVRRELLRRWKLVCVLKRLLLEPLEAVELELLLLDLSDMK